MAFHEVRFPTDLSFGALGGPERRTDIVALTSGFEERNTPWAHARRRYDAGLGLRSLDDIEALIAFFEARRGQLYGFRWKDWSDYRSCLPSSDITALDQVIGTGDGVRVQFPLTKTYQSGGASYARPITKPVESSVVVSLDTVLQQKDVQYTLDPALGQVVFAEPPANGAVVAAGFEFDVPVRFDTSQINVSLASFQAGHVPDVPVIEVRV